MNDLGDIVFLEKADGGDSCGPGFQTRFCVRERNATKRQDWDVGFAGFTEFRETCGLRGG